MKNQKRYCGTHKIISRYKKMGYECNGDHSPSKSQFIDIFKGVDLGSGR